MNIYQYHTDPEYLDHYEERLTRVPKFAYERAKSLLRRFPEGEAAIAKSAYYAYGYAIDTSLGTDSQKESRRSLKIKSGHIGMLEKSSKEDSQRERLR